MQAEQLGHMHILTRTHMQLGQLLSVLILSLFKHEPVPVQRDAAANEALVGEQTNRDEPGGEGWWTRTEHYCSLLSLFPLTSFLLLVSFPSFSSSCFILLPGLLTFFIPLVSSHLLVLSKFSLPTSFLLPPCSSLFPLTSYSLLVSSYLLVSSPCFSRFISSLHFLYLSSRLYSTWSERSFTAYGNPPHRNTEMYSSLFGSV